MAIADAEAKGQVIKFNELQTYLKELNQRLEARNTALTENTQVLKG